MARTMEPVTYVLPNGQPMTYEPPYQNLIWLGDHAIHYEDPRHHKRQGHGRGRRRAVAHPVSVAQAVEQRRPRETAPPQHAAKPVYPATLSGAAAVHAESTHRVEDARPAVPISQGPPEPLALDPQDPVEKITQTILTTTSARTRRLLIQSVLSGAYWHDHPGTPREVRERAQATVSAYLSY